jgi:hypothetical protein
MWQSNLDYSKFGPLSYAPLDDDYLEYEDHHKSKYHYEDEWDEDEAVEEYYIDPLRLAKEKSSYAAANA